MMPPVVYLYPETSTAMQPMAIEFAPGSAMKEIRPRIGRTKTLDGGVHYDHRGLTDGDRNILIRTRITAAQTETLRGLMALGQRFYLATEEALWLGHIARITDSDGDAVIEYWPVRRVGDASTITYPDAYVSYSVSIPRDDFISVDFFGNTNDTGSAFMTLGANRKTAIKFISTIPAGATIVSAAVRFSSVFDHSGAGSFTLTTAWFEDADKDTLPADFLSFPNETGLTDYVYWGVGAWENGGTYDSADMAASLQTVIDLAGYASGNSIMWYGYSSSGSYYRYAAITPTLEVTYST